jgi:hypothetical protein
MGYALTFRTVAVHTIKRWIIAMSESGADPGYYRSKAAYMRRLADQAQPGVSRVTYLLLEASWLRLAETSEKIREPGEKSN